MKSNRFQPPSDETRAYMDAVWDFMVEHCDITPNGAYFVKFHASGKFDFEKRVRARLKYGYHRIDERTGFTNAQKEADATARRAAHESRKQAKKRAHILSRDKQKEVFAAMRREREDTHIEQLASTTPPNASVINSLDMQGVALPWYTRVKLWLKSNLKHRQRLNANTAPLQQSPLSVSSDTSGISTMA